jgi:hypothetical protein
MSKLLLPRSQSCPWSVVRPERADAALPSVRICGCRSGAVFVRVSVVDEPARFSGGQTAAFVLGESCTPGAFSGLANPR